MPASTRDARETRTNLPVVESGLSGASVFLDFDGTLVEIAETPDAVRPDPALTGLLSALHRATEGRTALISGRSAEDVRSFLPDFPGIVVGGHGAEMIEDGRITRHAAADSPERVTVLSAAHDFASGRPGILVEEKPTGVVVHYRQAPESQAEVERLIRRLAEANPMFEFHASKMAAELRPDGIGKEAAIVSLMARDDWTGTVPVFLGDDATDEPALAWVAASGGLAIKVGEGESAAPYHLDDPAAVRKLLRTWIEDTLK